MAPHTPRTTFFRRRNIGLTVAFSAFISVVFSLSTFSAVAASSGISEFDPSGGESEFLPAVAGEPSVDFCAKWNPEFAYRGYRCCSNQITRGVAQTGRKGRRRAQSCAPDRIKWSFCDEMTPQQREYAQNVKLGFVDPLESVQKNMGSRGGQAFCTPVNGFLVEGRPILASAANRIEIRNEARCSNFGTDPLVGAMEWVGREIKKEFHEAEFDRARLIMGDASAPRGGCIAGRRGGRAHKSHTSGMDIDVTFFNPRAGYAPEERFTRTFYVASNLWFLKKVFKNPFACVKVIFTDQKNIRMLERYAKDDLDWQRLRKFVRHSRGHKDHFHVRVGSGPGVAGCMSDPNLEETEDGSDESSEGLLVKGGVHDDTEAADEDSNDNFEEATPARQLASMEADVNDTTVNPSVDALTSDQGLASKPQMASVTLPPHKMEPSISMKFQEKPRKRRSKSKHSRRVVRK